MELYDLNARYYDPSIARFLTEDPYYNLGNRVMGVYEINVPNVYSIMQANALYAYCGNSPIKLIDPTGKWPEWIENEVSRSTLTFISYKQYPWMVSIAPAASLRIDYAIDQVEDNKDIINAVSEAYLVRADIMGAIIYKEQLTQSLPDSLANIDSQYVTKKPHSVGLAAIYPGLARSAWQYVNPDVYNSLPESDAELQLMLTDPDFNVQTLAASLRYIAGTFHDISLDELQTITDEQWKWILYDYNYANSYNEKVMEYIPSIQELLD